MATLVAPLAAPTTARSPHLPPASPVDLRPGAPRVTVDLTASRSIERPTVVVLARDPGSRAIRARALAAAGLRVVAVATMAAARDALRTGAACLVLDRHVVDGDGLALVDELYCTEGAPRMVVVTTTETERERIETLVAGADDVVSPHVSVSEFVTRVRRLATSEGAARQGRERAQLRVGRVTIDQDRRSVSIDGAEVALSPTQYQILVSLAVEHGQAVTVRTLLERCWDRYQEQSSCAVRTQVTRLRRALRGAVEIRCVRGEGYRLAEAEG